ncbi:MAG TPA: hypothetical protein VD997_01695 [Phycisphaerales bacterium]|nr:hypothetical protein [Phycisphaerales bacterium]
MRTSFIPRADAAFVNMSRAFSTRLSADPAAFHVSETDAAEVAAAVAAWHAAFAATRNPSTRTTPAVHTKDQRRADAERVIRRVAALIRVNPLVSSALKVGIGIRPPPRRFPLNPAPHECPSLKITNDSHERHLLRVINPTSPRSARPHGTVGLLLVRVISDGPAAGRESAEFVAVLTRDRVTLDAPRAAPGTHVTYFAAWIGTRGDLSPWSQGASAHIAPWLRGGACSPKRAGDEDAGPAKLAA